MAAGKKMDSKYLKLFVKFGENENAKLGIAVSSKTFNKATERNRARRLVSTAFEALYSLFPKDINILALPKAAISNVKSHDVLSDLESLLKNEKIIGEVH